MAALFYMSYQIATYIDEVFPSTSLRTVLGVVRAKNLQNVWCIWIDSLEILRRDNPSQAPDTLLRITIKLLVAT